MRGDSCILQLSLRVYLIVFERHFSGTFLDANSHNLSTSFGRSRIANNIIAKNQILGFTTHPDAGCFVLASVVFNHILLQAIAVSGHAFGFIAEKDPVPRVSADFIFLQEIVGIFVTDRNPISAVVFQEIFFEQ